MSVACFTVGCIQHHFGFCSSWGSPSNTGRDSSSCRTLRSMACFAEMDGDSFRFIIKPDLFIACLCSAAPVGPLWPCKDAGG